jgi:isopentenyl-diphosphate delta-isomerase
MNKIIEQVVLVDDQDTPLGLADKSTVHQAETPSHRAFSCFLFRSNGSLILQQRATSKKTWPLVWSNTCCGHPLPDETRESAVLRRLQFELGIKPDALPNVHCFVPNYRYKATFLGVMEHEICPVFVGQYEGDFDLNPSEVEATQDVVWSDFIQSILDPLDTSYDHLSIWCREEAVLLNESDDFQAWLQVL